MRREAGVELEPAVVSGPPRHLTGQSGDPLLDAGQTESGAWSRLSWRGRIDRSRVADGDVDAGRPAPYRHRSTRPGSVTQHVGEPLLYDAESDRLLARFEQRLVGELGIDRQACRPDALD